MMASSIPQWQKRREARMTAASGLYRSYADGTIAYVHGKGHDANPFKFKESGNSIDLNKAWAEGWEAMHACCRGPEVAR